MCVRSYQEAILKTATIDQPEVIRVREFAARLQISIWTARQWAYRGKIASCKVGKHLLVPVGEVSRLISEGNRPRLEEK